MTSRCAGFLAGLAFASAAALAAEGGEEDSPAIPAGIQFESFSLILDNNIFSANREDRARLEAERQRRQEDSIPVDRFSLVGTMHTDGKPLAFFSGSSSQYRGVLKPDDEIAGYRVTEIGEKSCTLEKDGESLAFNIGMGMSRRGDEPWEISESAGRDFRGSIGGRSSSRASSSRYLSRSSSSSSSSSDETSEPSSASKSDILKKMMERRRQQMNQ